MESVINTDYVNNLESRISCWFRDSCLIDLPAALVSPPVLVLKNILLFPISGSPVVLPLQLLPSNAFPVVHVGLSRRDCSRLVACGFGPPGLEPLCSPPGRAARSHRFVPEVKRGDLRDSARDSQPDCSIWRKCAAAGTIGSAEKCVVPDV